jgi:hypothetical protein
MVYVFKTSVKTQKIINQLIPELNYLLPNTKWNFDLEDCDNILRVENAAVIPEIIIVFLQNKGFYCEELTD